jgi:NADH-quinone oxidoreductase subunit N
LALALAVFLFAQAGVPLTSGFFGKFYVISAAVDAGSTWLAVVAMLAAVVAAFLYLRIVASMYMSDDDPESGSGSASAAEAPRIRVPATAAVALVVCLVVTVGIGVWPGLVTEVTQDAVPVLSALG